MDSALKLAARLQPLDDLGDLDLGFDDRELHGPGAAVSAPAVLCQESADVGVARPVEDVVILDKPAQPGKSKVRLLVVEDDMGARTAVSEALRAYNYDVLSAANGMEAVKVVGENQGKIDLVISDLVMPGMSGVALYKQLAEEYPEISILFMTGYPLKNDTRELLESGGVTWLAKPIHMRALVRAIQKVLKTEKPQVPAEVIAN